MDGGKWLWNTQKKIMNVLFVMITIFTNSLTVVFSNEVEIDYWKRTILNTIPENQTIKLELNVIETIPQEYIDEVKKRNEEGNRNTNRVLEQFPSKRSRKVV